ncbi:phage tail protein [Pseudomonas sp. PCH446]
MTETFSYSVQLGSDGEISQRTWENEFGDGYTQAGGIGINTKSQTWNLSHTGLLVPGDELFDLRAFLDRHEGYKSFFWTPPGGEQGRYRANGYTSRPLGAGLYTFSFKFKQVYTP